MWTVLLGGAVLACVCIPLLFLLLIPVVSGPPANALAFDAARWQAAPRSDWSHDAVRLRMVDDFLATQRPLGKSRDAIVALLGEPDDTEYFAEFDMVYRLGPERGLGVDSEWLVFKLTNGTVTDVQTLRD
jgi:hypothetical protein